MAEYTGWDDYLKEQEKDENSILEARLSAIEAKMERLSRYSSYDYNWLKNIDEKLKYNQIRLPADYGPKRFTPANIQDRWKAGF